MCNHITLNIDYNLLRPEHFDLLFQLQLKSSFTVSLEMLVNHPYFPAEDQDKSGYTHQMVDNYFYFKTEISNAVRPTSPENVSPLMLAAISDDKQAMFNIMEEYCPSFNRTERGIGYVFKLFQRKYNFLFRVKDYWYFDGYDLPAFSRLSRAQKKNMTLQDVPKVTAQQKIDMFDDLEFTFNLFKCFDRVGIHFANYLHRIYGPVTSRLLPNSQFSMECTWIPYTYDASKTIFDYYPVVDNGRDEEMINLENNNDDFNAEQVIDGGNELIYLDTETQEERVLAEDFDLEQFLVTLKYEAEGGGNFDKFTMLRHIVSGTLSYRQINYEIKRAIKYGRFKKGLTASKIVRDCLASWAAVGCNALIPYCPCQLTTYAVDKSDLLRCERCKNKLNKSEAKFMKYESVRSILAAVFLNDDLMMLIEKERARNANKETLGTVYTGLNYINSMKEETEFVRIFNIALTSDGINCHNKRYYGVNVLTIYILDLPRALRTKLEFCFCPTLHKTARNSPGYFAEMTKLLFADLHILQTEGFKVTKGNVTYTIKVNLIGIVADTPALALYTETAGASAKFPCQFCLVSKQQTLLLASSYAQAQPYHVTTGHMRHIFENNLYETDVTWKCKAPYAVYYHHSLDFMNILQPDLMHTLFENLLPSIMQTVCSKEFEDISKVNVGRLLENVRKDIHDVNWLFEERSNVVEMFSENFTKANKRFKAIDAKLLTQLLPFLFRKSFETNASESDVFSEILVLLSELGSYMNLLLTLNVPKRLAKNDGLDQNELKKGFLMLLLKIESFLIMDGVVQQNFKFLGEIFRLPLHMMIHMFDRFIVVGSHADLWCFVGERFCKFVKGMLKAPGGNDLEVYYKRISLLAFTRAVDISDYTYDPHYCYDFKVGKKIDSTENARELMMFKRKFGLLQAKGKFICRRLTDFRSRGEQVYARSADTKDTCYAKIEGSDGSYRFVQVTDILKFEYFETYEDEPDKLAVLMRIRDVTVVRKWRKCVYQKFEFCFYATIDPPTARSQTIWVNDDSVIFPCYLSKTDKLLIDRHPCYGEGFRDAP